MKATAIGMAGLLMLAGGLSAQKSSTFSVQNYETFMGTITDSFCADNGRHIGLTRSEKNCVLTCVKFNGAQFVLYNREDNRIYKLDDQSRPEAFAGREVAVTGSYNKEEKTIHVISIRPKITYVSKPA